jgi:hypothetical protein
VWEELGWLFEEGLYGVVEAAEIGVWGAGHCERLADRNWDESVYCWIQSV